METRKTGHHLTLCVRFANGIDNIETVLRGADAICVIYNPSTVEVESSLQLINQFVSKQSELTPLALATIVTKPLPTNMDYFRGILKSSRQITLDLNRSTPDKYVKVTQCLLYL